MAEAGCPDLPSNAIARIERGERGISVNELVALAKVFDVSVTNLLTSVEWLRQKRAERLLEELREAHEGVRACATKKLELILELVKLGGSDTDALNYIVAHGSGWYESGKGKPLIAVQQEDGTDADVTDETLRTGLMDLDFAIFAQAREIIAAGEEYEEGRPDGER